MTMGGMLVRVPFDPLESVEQARLTNPAVCLLSMMEGLCDADDASLAALVAVTLTCLTNRMAA